MSNKMRAQESLGLSSSMSRNNIFLSFLVFKWIFLFPTHFHFLFSTAVSSQLSFHHHVIVATMHTQFRYYYSVHETIHNENEDIEKRREKTNNQLAWQFKDVFQHLDMNCLTFTKSIMGMELDLNFSFESV